jgi:hypothetical protein
MFGYFSSPDLRKGNKGAEPVLLSSVSWNSELKAGAHARKTTSVHGEKHEICLRSLFINKLRLF